jgi:hypothetical protein
MRLFLSRIGLLVILAAAGCNGGGDQGDQGGRPDADADAGAGTDTGADTDTDTIGDGGDEGIDAGSYPCQVGVPQSVDVMQDTEMLIVTDSRLRAAFDVLAGWKRAKGVPTELVTTTWINQNVAGADGAERVRNYIRQLFDQKNLGYVLLGGDDDMVPCRVVHSKASVIIESYEEDFASDFYFSDLDGTWDDDGNGTFGELSDGLDMHPDVAVGRIPVSSAREAEYFIDRLLAYEQTDPGHVQDALFISEDTGILGFDSAVQLDPLADDVFPSRFAKRKLYWRYDQYPDAEENTYEAQVDALNAGLGFVTHYGHSSEFQLNSQMTASQVVRLSNAPHFPLYISCGCHAGNFIYDSADAAGENLFFYPGGGAIAYLGNTNYGLGPAGGTDFIRSFYEALFAGTLRLGDVLNQARDQFYSNENDLHTESKGTRWTQLVVVLFGDPEMPVRTETPGVLTMEYPTAVARGEQCLEVTVFSGGQPLPGARVALHRSDDFLYRQETDAAGRTTFRLDITRPGDILITATCPQTVPALGAIVVP